MVSLSELSLMNPHESEMPDGCLGGFVGLCIGAVAGAGYLGYQGYQLGEWVTKNYEIINPFLENSMDICSSIAGGIVGTSAGAVVGVFAGMTLEYVTGKFKNNKLIKER